jgi:hypothetical protein
MKPLAAAIWMSSLMLARGASAELPPQPEAAVTPRAATPPETTWSKVRLAVQAEPAFGVSGGSFYNQLVGARVDYRFTDKLSLGPYLAYANLKGPDGRANNVLPALELEYRPSLGSGSSFGLPLRFSTGYLPQNGPLLRLSAGISYAFSPNVDLVLDAFTPTFWVIRNRTVASLGGALEVSYAPSGW